MVIRYYYLPLLLALSLCRVEVAHSSPFPNRRHASFIVPSSTSSSLSLAVSNRRPPTIDRRWNNKQITSSKKRAYHLSLKLNDDSEIPKNNNKDNNQRIGDDNQSSFSKYGRPQDITSDSFGALLPVAAAVDAATGGWGLSYADLRPATPRTPVGVAFLATNLAYAVSGLLLAADGDLLYGALTEIAGAVSFAYHYAQLELGENRGEVRLALLVDYFCAGAALLTGGAYMVQGGIGVVPLEALVSAGAAAACLSLCWVWEYGYPYIFWHSLWHIASAYTGYIVGQDHLSRIAG